MVQTITTERSQYQREFWLRMAWTLNSFTTEVIPPSRWKRGLGRNRQSIPSITQRRYYNVSNLPAETFFKGLGLATRPSIFHQRTEAELRVNIYCIFLFQMGGNLECIRYCIYDSTASPLFLSLPAPSLNPAPFLLCNKLSYLFRPARDIFLYEVICNQVMI